MIQIVYGIQADIHGWMQLVQKVSNSFPGLETEKALTEHRQTVLDFMSRQEAICAKDNGKIVVPECNFLVEILKWNPPPLDAVDICVLGIKV